VKPHFNEIPEELRELPNWVVWRLEKRAGKGGIVRETKVPYNARTHRLAASNRQATWSSFGDATEALKALGKGYNGLGFCLTRPFVGVDLDGCRPSGNDEPWAEEILGELDTYSELSPSHTGIHAIVKGELPDGPRQKDFGDREHHGIGLYDAARGRYLTVTGERIRAAATIPERTIELRRIHARLFPPQPPKAKGKPKAGASLPDDDLITRALRANDGGKFARLWNGQWEGDYPSQSEADLALCLKLAFWTNRDAGRTDALFRRSGLMREKWNRDDYRERTIEAALARQTETRTSPPWPREETIVLAAGAVEPSLETLNAMALFHGRLRFQSVSRRGSMILATTAENQQIIWPTMNDLTTFARARAAIAEGADVLLPQPPKNQVASIWDPAANMIIRLAARDAIRVEHVLKAECKDLLILMWRYAKQPNASNSAEFMNFLIAIAQSVRDRERPAPPCVFTAEEFCWVHLPTFRNWISLSSLTNRLYPLGDIRQGLLLLGFDYQKDVTRGHGGNSASASLWRGPLDVLLE
jgi:hypothetical protein